MTYKKKVNDYLNVLSILSGLIAAVQFGASEGFGELLSASG